MTNPFFITAASLLVAEGWQTQKRALMDEHGLSSVQAVKTLCGLVFDFPRAVPPLKVSAPVLVALASCRPQGSREEIKNFGQVFEDLTTFMPGHQGKQGPRHLPVVGDLPTPGTVWLVAWHWLNHPQFKSSRYEAHDWPEEIKGRRFPHEDQVSLDELLTQATSALATLSHLEFNPISQTRSLSSSPTRAFVLWETACHTEANQQYHRAIS